MLEGEVFVSEFGTVNGLSTGTVVIGKVTPLAHESRDNPVKSRALESHPLFTGAECSEILGCLGNNVVAKLKRKQL